MTFLITFVSAITLATSLHLPRLLRGLKLLNRRPSAAETADFIEQFGLPPGTKIELIEVGNDGRFDFYMVAFTRPDSDETSITVYWPHTKEKAHANEDVSLERGI